MIKLFYRLPNGKCFAHVSRSGTTTLAAHALKEFYPTKNREWRREKLLNGQRAPQAYLTENWASKLPKGCLVMVRNPIDRLQSMIARNSYPNELVEFAIGASTGEATTDRDTSRRYSILKHQHLAPLHCIAEEDSHFVRFPDFKDACNYLGMNYEPEVHLNAQRGTVKELEYSHQDKLRNSMSMTIWESLNNN
jgi:hypothetical protein